MEKVSIRESFQTISEVSSSESFLSSLEIVINGRKNSDFAPYLQKILSPLPVPLASFLFYTLIYIHFHLLMLIIVLRLFVEQYVIKLRKIQHFYERFREHDFNQVINQMKSFFDIIKNNYSYQLKTINQISEKTTIQQNSSIAFSNEFSSFPSLTRIESAEFQSCSEINSIIYENIKMTSNLEQEVDSNSFNTTDYKETFDEVMEKNDTLINDDKKEYTDIDNELKLENNSKNVDLD